MTNHLKKILIIILCSLIISNIGFVNVFGDDEETVIDNNTEETTEPQTEETNIAEPIQSQYFELDGIRYKVTTGLFFEGEEPSFNDNDESTIFVMSDDKSTAFFIGVSKLDEYGGTDTPAPDEVNSLIINSITVNTKTESYLIVNESETITYRYRYTDESGTDITKIVDTKKFKINVDPDHIPSYPDDKYEDLDIAFTVNDQLYHFTFRISFLYDQDNYFELAMDNDNIIIKDTNYLLNDILKSKQAFSDFYHSTTGRTLNNLTSIIFQFDPAVEYHGNISINCYESADDAYYIYFDSKDTSSIVTINGSFTIGTGNITLSHLHLVYSDIDTALSAINRTGQLSIENCSFTGFKTAVETDSAWINGSLFEYNETGLILNGDKSSNNSFCDSSNFVNNKTAIILKDDYSDLLLRENCFYGTTQTDFLVGKDFSDTFFVDEPFFGIDYETGYINSNIRSAKVNYEETNGQLVTSPCIRYPENDDYKLGIDTAEGIITKFKVNPYYDHSIHYMLDLQNIINKDSETEADLYSVEYKKDIASIIFPAGITSEETQFGIEFDYTDKDNMILSCDKNSEKDLFETVKPQIKLPGISKASVYLNDKRNKIPSEIIDGTLYFTLIHTGQYIITLPSDYDYVGPDEDSMTRSDVVQSYTINSGNTMKLVFKNLGAETDDAYEAFMTCGEVMIIDRDTDRTFQIEKDESLYTTKKGSLVLILSDKFLNSLTTGKHILSLSFPDGYADAELMIETPIVSNKGAAVKAAASFPNYQTDRIPITGN